MIHTNKIANYNDKGDDGTYFNFIFYGTFAARDRYGDLIDFYKYNWEVKVNKNEGLKLKIMQKDSQTVPNAVIQIFSLIENKGNKV